MKKILILLLASVLLGACGNDGKDEVKEEPKEETEKQETTSTSVDEEPKEDGQLVEVGQKIKDKDLKATVELLAIKSVNETIELDPIELTIDDIKLIRMTDIKSKEFKSYLKQFTDEEDIEFIQIMYTMKNTEDKNVNLYQPITTLVLNTGEQIEVAMNDFVLDPNNGGEFYGKVTKDSGVSVLIDKSDVQDIKEIKIITGDTWDDEDNMLNSQVEKTYTFD